MLLINSKKRSVSGFTSVLCKIIILCFKIIIYLLLNSLSQSILYAMDQDFSPWIYGQCMKPIIHKSVCKKLGSVTYSTDWENEVSKIYTVSPGSNGGWRFTSKQILNLLGGTMKYSPLNWPIIAHTYQLRDIVIQHRPLS